MELYKPSGVDIIESDQKGCTAGVLIAPGFCSTVSPYIL